MRRPARGPQLWMQSGIQSTKSFRSPAGTTLQVIAGRVLCEIESTFLQCQDRQIKQWLRTCRRLLVGRSEASDSIYLLADVFSKEAFRKAMTVIFAHAAYLDAAQCFALLPIATLLRRTGREDAAVLNFDLDRQSSTLTANRLYGSALLPALSHLKCLAKHWERAHRARQCTSLLTFHACHHASFILPAQDTCYDVPMRKLGRKHEMLLVKQERRCSGDVRWPPQCRAVPCHRLCGGPEPFRLPCHEG